MNIKGLDYNTQRTKLRLNTYGRQVQQMVDHCLTLPTKEERQCCARTIIETMKRMHPVQQNMTDRMQTLWNHLALMSDFQLDIDYPVQVVTAEETKTKPSRVPYPSSQIKAKHYGKELFMLFDILKTMEPGKQRDELVVLTANHMKRCLAMYGHGNADNARVADDLERFTDGVIELDLNKFNFAKTESRTSQRENKKKKKK